MVVILECAWQGWTLEWLETWAWMNISMSQACVSFSFQWSYLVFLCSYNSQGIQPVSQDELSETY